MDHKKDPKSYHAKPVDKEGNVLYSDEENQVWHDLMVRQVPLLADRACDEYIRGMQRLDLPRDRVPQCKEVSRVLQETTGWALEPVPALISFARFFSFIGQ